MTKDTSKLEVILDTDREARNGAPEVVYCASKDTVQLDHILSVHTGLEKKDAPLILSRLSSDKFASLTEQHATLKYFEKAQVAILGDNRPLLDDKVRVAVVTAGTSDVSVAEETAVTLEALGHNVDRVYDVGVAGIHRILNKQDTLQQATVCIVLAGMEGALPSVVAGLTPAPVIAVPTSVGYGASFKGLSALLGMLNSCSPGLSVVNIDNGLGAAIIAHKTIGQMIRVSNTMGSQGR